MKFKKAIALTLCVAALAVTAGCNNEQKSASSSADVITDENVTAPGELPIVKEPIELTVGIMSSSKVKNYDTNAFTKYLEEKTGINLKFYEFPASGGADKLNVMLSSGTELPEILCGFGLGKSTFSQYEAEGVFVDLTKYIDEYGYWMKDVYKKTKVGNLDSYMKSFSGKKYFMPAIVEQDSDCYPGKAFINKVWLDKLGLEVPQTIDEFEKVMEAFKTQDPNGNGKADEIGFTGSSDGWYEKPVNFLMNSFVYDDYNDGYVVDDNNKIFVNYNTDEYKEGLKYISRLAEKGLIDMQSYTQTSESLRAICSAEDEIVGAFASGSPDSLFISGDERMSHYVPLPPLKGPNGIEYTPRLDYPVSASGVITKYCKHPAAAYRLLDFMMSEEASLFSRYGVEGTDWERVDESKPCLFESIGYKSKILAILPYGAVQNSHWTQYNPSFRSSDISNTMAWDGNKLDGEYFKAQALAAYIGKGPENVFNVSKLLLDNDDFSEFVSIKHDIGDCVKETIPSFISGRKNLDSDWNEYMETLKNLGIDRYIELAQKGYDKFNDMSE